MSCSGAIVRVTVRGVALAIVFCCAGCRERVPPSETARIVLEEHPQTIDLSLFEGFQAKIDGVDVSADVPQAVIGSESNVTGHLKAKAKALGPTESVMLKVAYRQVVDGQADWSLDDRDLNAVQQQVISLERDGTIGGAIKVDESMGFRPGEYELRFYAIRQDYVDDTKLPIAYHVGKGKLTVLPPDDAATKEDGSAGATP